MTWVLRDSVIDALALDDEVRDQAQAMAGESAVAVTDDRENILHESAAEIERYRRTDVVSRAWWITACRHERVRD